MPKYEGPDDDVHAFVRFQICDQLRWTFLGGDEEDCWLDTWSEVEVYIESLAKEIDEVANEFVEEVCPKISDWSNYHPSYLRDYMSTIMPTFGFYAGPVTNYVGSKIEPHDTPDQIDIKLKVRIAVYESMNQHIRLNNMAPQALINDLKRQRARNRCNRFKEELMQWVWHPDRIKLNDDA